MNDARTDKKFPRYWTGGSRALLGGWICTIVLLAVAQSWTDGFTRWDPPTMVNGSLVMECIVLALVVGTLFFVVLPDLETIHITQEEVRCQLGPVVVWRLPFTDIRTVIRTGSPVTDIHAPPKYILYTEKKFRYLIFSMVEAEELRLRCRSMETKKRDKKGQFRMKHGKRATDQEVKYWHERRRLLLRFRMEWTEEAESTLRQRMTTTTFIL